MRQGPLLQQTLLPTKRPLLSPGVASPPALLASSRSGSGGSRSYPLVLTPVEATQFNQADGVAAWLSPLKPPTHPPAWCWLLCLSRYTPSMVHLCTLLPWPYTLCSMHNRQAPVAFDSTDAAAQFQQTHVYSQQPLPAGAMQIAVHLQAGHTVITTTYCAPSTERA